MLASFIPWCVLLAVGSVAFVVLAVMGKCPMEATKKPPDQPCIIMWTGRRRSVQTHETPAANERFFADARPFPVGWQSSPEATLPGRTAALDLPRSGNESRRCQHLLSLPSVTTIRLRAQDSFSRLLTAPLRRRGFPRTAKT